MTYRVPDPNENIETRRKALKTVINPLKIVDIAYNKELLPTLSTQYVDRVDEACEALLTYSFFMLR